MANRRIITLAGSMPLFESNNRSRYVESIINQHSPLLSKYMHNIELRRITSLNLSCEVINMIDSLVKERLFYSRSECIRYFILRELEERLKDEELNSKIDSIVSAIKSEVIL